MSYLARLKAEIPEKRAHDELTRPTKAPSVSYVSAQGGHIPESEQGEQKPDLAPVASENHDAGAHYRWRVTLPDGTPFEVCCLPETTAEEMRALYAGARVEPLPNSPGALAPGNSARAPA